MPKTRLFIICVICLLISVIRVFAQQQEERLTITTYYPSPFGVYNELRLHPKTTAQRSECNENNVGDMYFDSNLQRLMVCKIVDSEVVPPRCEWVQIGGNMGAQGSGDENYVAKWTGDTTLGNSQIFDDGVTVGIATGDSPDHDLRLDVRGGLRADAEGTAIEGIGAVGVKGIGAASHCSLSQEACRSPAGSPPVKRVIGAYADNFTCQQNCPGDSARPCTDYGFDCSPQNTCNGDSTANCTGGTSCTTPSICNRCSYECAYTMRNPDRPWDCQVAAWAECPFRQEHYTIDQATGVYGEGTRYGIHGNSTANPWIAGYFEGNVNITRQLWVADNVGIGTESPQARLDVRGNLHVSDNVGIGTSAPQARLDVNGGIRFTAGNTGQAMASGSYTNKCWCR